METWYKQQEYFSEDKLDRIKAWMDLSYPKVIDLRDFKEAIGRHTVGDTDRYVREIPNYKSILNFYENPAFHYKCTILVR
jgi:hypothetical protein